MFFRWCNVVYERCALMTDDACGRVVAHVRISVMHNNLQASVRVEYAFYAGQSLQYDYRLRVGYRE